MISGKQEPDDAPALISIDNAGLILTAPFLPAFFGALGMLQQEDTMQLSDRQVAPRAVHLLQYLVDARTSAPEPLLALNKILCGLAVTAQIDKAIDITDQERALSVNLLKSMIANWKALSGTSMAGLRETFLQREGRLTQSADAWELKVQRKTLDVLVDQIPWNISKVLHRWMKQPIHVSWRCHEG